MPVITAAGPAFNGGTITTPLVVATGNVNTIPEEIDFSLSGQNVNVWTLHSTDGGGTDIVYVDAFGTLNASQGLGVSSFLNVAGPLALTGLGNGLQTKAITSGALSTVSLSSGVAHQNSLGRDGSLVVPITYNPTAGAAATCKVELSPDNVTYSTLGTFQEPAGVALDNTIMPVSLYVPYSWYVKITVVNATIGTGTLY